MSRHFGGATSSIIPLQQCFKGERLCSTVLLRFIDFVVGAEGSLARSAWGKPCGRAGVLGAVGQELGYEDALHFPRVFRKIMGCAPSSVKARG
ncbi:MAG: hypothetical protein ACI81V_001447 [Lentimonas sp.]|jgi:hypothetical protein